MEEQLTTLEGRLNSLIDKAENTIIDAKQEIERLRKIVNKMLTIAGILFIPFLYSFVDVRVKISDLQSAQMPKDDMYRLFVQKTDALSVMMYRQDWVNTQLYKITQDTYYKDNDEVKDVIKAFFSEQHRSASFDKK